MQCMGEYDSVNAGSVPYCVVLSLTLQLFMQ